MAGFATFLFVYLFGGLTFLPLLLVAAVYYGTRPAGPSTTPPPGPGSDDSAGLDGSKNSALRDDYNYDGLARPGDDTDALDAVRREHAHEAEASKKRRPDPADEVATAGYFAVLRKYVAMGVNSKPVEPSTVGPTPVAPPSPSVYQNFFRSMLNGKKQPGPEAVEISHASAPRPKNARNMFYVVLRHGHLILFDDDQQVDVRHVIKLADHEVGIYSGQPHIPEGELFIKRNALVLLPKNTERALAHNAPAPQPWFFYSENCSEKEDFYFALLHGQENHAPVPRTIDVRHLTSLMERLHASEEAAEMRWFNAFLGRLFLGVYKTPDLQAHFKKKVITKLSRTPRPGFISKLDVQRVDIGETTPQFTNPRLKSLTAEGECIIEADVRYSGHVEIDIAATIRVSTPISQQEVKTTLAVVLTRLDGHVMFKIKAPPSNRIWFSFRHMPKVEMEVRPIIMARQLTWPVFIQMIENRIKEAMSESIVLPFWDDVPFFATDEKRWRGGIWNEADEEELEILKEKEREEKEREERHKKNNKNKKHRARDDADAASILTTATGAESILEGTSASSAVSINGEVDGDEPASPAVMRLRRLSKSYTAPVSNNPSAAASASSSSLNRVATEAFEKGRASFKRRQKKNTVYGEPADAPESSGSGSTATLPKRFSRTTASLTSSQVPIAETDNVHAEVFKASASPPKGGKTAMAWLAARAPPSRKSSVSSVESDNAGDRTNGNGNDGIESTGLPQTASDSELVERHSRKPFSEDAPREDDGTGDEALDTAPDTLPEQIKKEVNRSRTSTASSNSMPASSARASTTSLSGGGGGGGGAVSGSSAATLGPNTAEGGHDSAFGSPSAAPQKRGVAIAAAMSGAAGAAKRWGISALQRRQAAAQERAAQKARAGFNNGEPLDLSKPMGGGMPLPPPGEPLPRPSELAAKEHMHNLPRKPVPMSRRTTDELGDRRSSQTQSPSNGQRTKNGDSVNEQASSSSEDILKRRRLTLEEKLRMALPTPPPQQEMLVVEAPIESDSEDDSSDDAAAEDLGEEESVAAKEKEADVASAVSSKESMARDSLPTESTGTGIVNDKRTAEVGGSSKENCPPKIDVGVDLPSELAPIYRKTAPAQLLKEEQGEEGSTEESKGEPVSDKTAANWGTVDDSVIDAWLDPEPEEDIVKGSDTEDPGEKEIEGVPAARKQLDISS